MTLLVQRYPLAIDRSIFLSSCCNARIRERALSSCTSSVIIRFWSLVMFASLGADVIDAGADCVGLLVLSAIRVWVAVGCEPVLIE